MLQRTLKTESHDHAMLAILARIVSGIFMAIMGGLVKIAENGGAHNFEVVFFRSAAALPVVLVWILLGPGLTSAKPRRPAAHLIRAAVGMISMFFMFYALSLLPLTEAMTVFFITPLVATCLSVIFLGDKVGIHRWIAIAIGFVGVVILMRPGSGTADISGWGLFIAAVAAMMMACVTITLRQVGSTENGGAVVLWFTVIGTIVTGCLYPFYVRSHEWTIWAAMAGVGMCGAVIQISTTTSLQLAPVSTTAPFDYAQLLWAILIGWLLWSDLPALSTIIGGLLIAGAGIYTVYRERLHRQSIAGQSTPVN